MLPKPFALAALTLAGGHVVEAIAPWMCGMEPCLDQTTPPYAIPAPEKRSVLPGDVRMCGMEPCLDQSTPPHTVPAPEKRIVLPGDILLCGMEPCPGQFPPISTRGEKDSGVTLPEILARLDDESLKGLAKRILA